jgi:hypothetical protein
LNSVSRLAALSSASSTQSKSIAPAATIVPDTNQINLSVPETTESRISESDSARASTDPPPDHLLAQASSTAKCLFHFRVVPQNATHSLLGTYTNAYSLAAVNEMQSKNAFSTPSPDDIVHLAQRPNKGAKLNSPVLIV